LSSLQNLSLRSNQLNDEACLYLSYAIGDIKRQNKKLLSLNLNTNEITDTGAIHLARSLRTNRTLLILSLANNYIGDIGAKAFADVISRFALTQEELFHRRFVISGGSFLSDSPTRKLFDSTNERSVSQIKSNNANISDTKSKKDKSGKKSNEPPANSNTKSDSKNLDKTLSKTTKKVDEKTLKKGNFIV
jgi:hypothetical protein